MKTEQSIKYAEDVVSFCQSKLKLNEQETRRVLSRAYQGLRNTIGVKKRGSGTKSVPPVDSETQTGEDGEED